MNYEFEQVYNRQGDEFYFYVRREDGVKGRVQLNMRFFVDEEQIEWDDERLSITFYERGDEE